MTDIRPDISTISGFIAWIVIFITYLRFRKAMQFHGMMDARPYTTRLQPYATWICLFIISILTITNGFDGKSNVHSPRSTANA
jgi:amino acid transporter